MTPVEAASLQPVSTSTPSAGAPSPRAPSTTRPSIIVDATPSPAASPSESPAATPPPSIGWQELELPSPRSNQFVTTIAHGGGSWVAGGGGVGIPDHGALWTSPNGREWTPAEADRIDDVLIDEIVAMDDTFFAFAPTYGVAVDTRTRVWRSDDGAQWTLLPPSADLGFVHDVAVRDDVLVAVGTNHAASIAAIWTSRDGIDWFGMPAPAGPTSLEHVAVRQSDIAVISDDFWEGHGRRLFVLPGDSDDWQEVDVFAEEVGGRLLDVTATGDRFVAVGYEELAAGKYRAVAHMSGGDVGSWTRTVLHGESTRVFGHVAGLPDGRFLAIATERSPAVRGCQPVTCVQVEESAQAWLSHTGADWDLAAVIYSRTVTYEDGEPAGDQLGGPRRALGVGEAGVVLAEQWEDGQLRVMYAPLSALTD